MTDNTRRYFGTDGIRGRVGEAPITPEFILKLGWAAGRVLGKGRGSRVLIGKDTRISGYMFESALEAGLSAAGVDIGLLGPMPTPGIAYLTRTQRASAGIVISASHNPYFDNGIKFFSADGRKLADSIELAIEQALASPLETVSAERLGKAQRVDDAQGRYIEFCKSTVPASLDLSGLRIVLDCAHGATYHIAPHVFSELRADISTIGTEPDGLNINDGFGSTQPQALQEAVLANGADLGIAFDGDGDRVLMVDDKGEALDGDELLYIIARSRAASDVVHGVVGTSMSNLGLEEALRSHDIDLRRADVGDRYVMQLLEQYGWSIGGESSGHIICLDRTTTGDGIVSALQVLAELQRVNRPLSDVRSGMVKVPQTLVNVSVPDRDRAMSSAAVRAALTAAEAQLGERGRVLLRPSGTEPLIRIMVESHDANEVAAVAEQLRVVISAAGADAA